MIQGLQVTLSATELQQLCTRRAEHHRERAAFYKSQHDTLREAIRSAQYTGADPKMTLRRQHADHLLAAQEMDFIASHLDMDERYQIDRQDMQRLGICQENHYCHDDIIPF
ncbi:MAG: hypothetical protein JNM65_01985 [Verrucomicrobiaceae bacterium]|nr:hypothetical protein [Verrucomicrobiaceae bacterium]